MALPELPLRRASLVMHELDTEAMLYDPDGDRVIRLNATARRVWELCGGDRSLDDIARVIEQEFHVDPGTDIHQDVVRTIAQFASAGLLANGSQGME
jgi:hypothetical protein